MSFTAIPPHKKAIQLSPAPPPTNNMLDSVERSRLLRSTRKLESVLGATPFLVEPETRLNPSPKASRREGRVFGHSPSSSVSSIDTTEPDYVLVKSSAQSAPYQVQFLPTDSPTSRPSFDSKLSSRKRKGDADTVLPPIALVFDIPGSKVRSGPGGNKGPSQPLLLRIRPAATRRPTELSIKLSSNQVPAKPLSPMSAAFNTDITPESHVLSDSEKRRKLAKLQRTLGENVPPELVFRPSPPTRHSSLSVRPRAEHLASFSRPSKFVPIGAPPMPVAEAPIPHPRAVNSTVEQPQKPTGLKHRARSLTRAASAAAATRAAASRGTSSMDGPLIPKEQPFAFVDAPVPESNTIEEPTEFEFGRRKEKEWSGEWNLKDMDDVAKKLRGLKGR